jgi:nucleoid-associated protein YgaU
LRGIGIMLRELATTSPKTAAARPEDFVDLTFIKELDNSGFIDRLYKTTPVVARRDDQRSTSGPPVVKENSALAAEKTKPTVTAASGATLPDGSREHIVAAGHTLSHIALMYYGNSLRWDKIYQANKAAMKNPHYLYIGQKILIPS